VVSRFNAALYRQKEILFKAHRLLVYEQLAGLLGSFSLGLPFYFEVLVMFPDRFIM
jgi:hypothetical protein